MVKGSSKPGIEIARLYEAKNSYLKIGRAHLLWQKNIIEWLETWNPDCLIAEINPRNRTTSTALRWMHRRSRKVIGWGLGQPGPGFLGGIKSTAWRNLVMQFDALITYSTLGKQQFAALGFEENRIYTAPNAVAPKPAVARINRPMHYQGSKPTLLFVGRLIERKRLDVLLNACAALPSELQPEILASGDGPARKGLENLARQVYPHTNFWAICAARTSNLTGRWLTCSFCPARAAWRSSRQ